MSNANKTMLGLRLVSKQEIDENLAVERAQRFANSKTHDGDWKGYLRNMDMFLGMELEYEDVIGIEFT